MYDRGQGGLLDVIITRDNIIYLSYGAADPADDSLATEVVREFNRRDFALKTPKSSLRQSPRLKAPTIGVPFIIRRSKSFVRHPGDRFDYRDRPKTLKMTFKVVRVMPDGSHAVYSYGHRNVQVWPPTPKPALFDA